MPWWLPLIGGYTALGSKVLIYAIATMGSEPGARVHRRPVVRAGRLFRSWRLRRRHDAEVSCASSTPLAILVGTLAGGIAATLLGPLVMRRRGIYFAMITIAIGQLFYFVMVRWNEVTGGEDGLAGFSPPGYSSRRLVVPADRDATSTISCCSVSPPRSASCGLLLQSPLGHTWVAIRENRRRVEFLGIRVERYVWAAFAIAGFITAFAGTLNALLFNFTSPQDLHWILSGQFRDHDRARRHAQLLRPAVGVIIFVVAQDYLSSVTGNWMTFIGMIFVLIVLLFPKRLLGTLRWPRRGSL